jgi:hypothetical protein
MENTESFTATIVVSHSLTSKNLENIGILAGAMIAKTQVDTRINPHC